MANRLCDVLLTTKPLKCTDHISDPRWGGVAMFHGVVRGTEDGREIVGIEYEAHGPMAEHQMTEIASGARDKFSLGAVVLHHRIGFVPVAEPSLVVQVASGHRQAALQAVAWIIDELKKQVPIWKKPVYANASAEQPAMAK